MLKNELETAIALARRAGESAMEYFAGEVIAEQKLGIDNFYEPVTAADRAASTIIVEGVAAAFPDDEILSEEEPDDPVRRLAGKRVWIVDPIDGTAGFVRKDGDFAIQIGLAENGRPVLGVVYLPFYKRIYYAVSGEGAFAADGGGTAQRLKVSDTSQFRDMRIALSKNHPAMKEVIDSFDFKKKFDRGSVGLKMGLVAEDTCDLYIHLSARTKLWDTCGPQAILEEAGGKLTDLYGNEFRYDRADLQNSGGIVATNGAAHDAVIAHIKPVLEALEDPRSKARAQ
ncbi:MAG: 3'(2'),5'-bisphosphate nucleotidase CysQ [Acidobacteriota bacterium]